MSFLHFLLSFSFFSLSFSHISRSSSSFPPNYNDPLYDTQWHLHNWHHPSDPDYSIDTGVTRVWENTRGSGVTIGFIIPDVIDSLHTDLKSNYVADLSLSSQRQHSSSSRSLSNTSSLSPSSSSSIGIAVAASQNKICGVGVAPKAKFTTLHVDDFLSLSQDDALSLSLSHKKNTIDIYCLFPSSPSSSSSSSYPFLTLGPQAANALKNGVEEGRKGKGSVFVVPLSGRGEGESSLCTHNSLIMSPHTIAVGSSSYLGHRAIYSPFCPSIHVVAPSNGNGRGLATNDNFDDCVTDYDGGTESSASFVAGAIALILSEYPKLTFHDILHILALSSLRIDLFHGEWITNSAGISYSRKYGFGLINLHSAFIHAEEWDTSRYLSLSSFSGEFQSSEKVIPDLGSFEFSVTCDVNITVEKIQLELNLIHPSPGDFRISVSSPFGTKSLVSDVFGIKRRDISLFIEGHDPFPLLEINLGAHFPLPEYPLSILSLPSLLSSFHNCSSSPLPCGCDFLRFQSSPQSHTPSSSLPLTPSPSPYSPEILILPRGLCSLETQIRNGERVGAKVVIVIDETDTPSPYEGDGWDIAIPSALIGKEEGKRLLNILKSEKVKGKITVSVVKMDDVSPYPPSWNMTSLAFWGEKCEGKWKITIADVLERESGKIKKGIFHAFGFVKKSDPPLPSPSPSPSPTPSPFFLSPSPSPHQLPSSSPVHQPPPPPPSLPAPSPSPPSPSPVPSSPSHQKDGNIILELLVISLILVVSIGCAFVWQKVSAPERNMSAFSDEIPLRTFSEDDDSESDHIRNYREEREEILLSDDEKEASQRLKGKKRSKENQRVSDEESEGDEGSPPLSPFRGERERSGKDLMKILDKIFQDNKDEEKGEEGNRQKEMEE